MKPTHKITWMLFILASISFILLRPIFFIRLATTVAQEKVVYLFDVDEKLVALTIDDGPHPTITPLILDLLKENQVKATFFLVGKNVKEHPDIVGRIVNEGHEIGNHTFDHNFSLVLEADEFDRQILETHQLINNFQTDTKWFRPGGGLYNRRIIDEANEFGYKTVLGSVYPYDANISEQLGGTRFIQTFIMQNTQPGGIIILHDGRIRTVNVLKQTLPQLADDGYAFVTLSKMESLTSKTNK
ncbi:MAG: polysaccharide deacetylase family protein [Anaerolineae bacterium]